MATQTQLYSARITGAELPRDGSPILISNYTVEPVRRADRDYRISLKGIEKPFSKANWMTQNGTITHAMLDLLVPQDALKSLRADNTYVWANPDPNLYEGLRTLDWGFGGRVRPALVSDGGLGTGTPTGVRCWVESPKAKAA